MSVATVTAAAAMATTTITASTATLTVASVDLGAAGSGILPLLSAASFHLSDRVVPRGGCLFDPSCLIYQGPSSFKTVTVTPSSSIGVLPASMSVPAPTVTASRVHSHVNDCLDCGPVGGLTVRDDGATADHKAADDDDNDDETAAADKVDLTRRMSMHSSHHHFPHNGTVPAYKVCGSNGTMLTPTYVRAKSSWSPAISMIQFEHWAGHMHRLWLNGTVCKVGHSATTKPPGRRWYLKRASDFDDALSDKGLINPMGFDISNKR